MLESSIKKLIQRPQNLTIDSTDVSNKSIQSNRIVTSRYTLFTFLPLNFFHQIKKGSTFFFFITLILMSFPRISPFEPFTYLFAFVIVVGVSMIKDGMEDYKRHLDDDILNSSKVDVVRCIEFEDNTVKFLINPKECMELEPGDFVLIKRDQEVFADVILLRSKAYHRDDLRCTNHCFVQTSSLDGETNLKKKTAIDVPKHFSCCKKTGEEHVAEIGKFDHLSHFNQSGNIISINRDHIPGTNMPSEGTSVEESHIMEDLSSPCYEHFFKKIQTFDLKDTGDSFDDFECDLNIDGNLAIADAKNVILRGSKLKNTEACLCLVVGVGLNTKLTKSLDKSKRLKTLFDSRMNHILGVVLALYALMMIITIAVGTLFLNFKSSIEYLNINNFGSSLLTMIFSNYILYIYLIPVSLYVMLEIARFIHAFYISSDSSMIIDNISSKCRNSSVIEDLGVIDYILTDKTGTITKNSMTLKQLHVNEAEGLITPEVLFESIKNLILQDNKNVSIESKIKNILDGETKEKGHLLFLLNMLICNSVEILNHKLESVSQEELCFLETTGKCGFKLIERDENKVVVEILDNKLEIEILRTREFVSSLQRMDVLARICDKIYLLVKGSDQKLLNKKKDKEKLDVINKSTEFRSLVMKYKELTKEEEKEFLMSTAMYFESMDEERTGNDKTMLQEKKQKENEGFNTLEENSKYLGSVFIEDEIQDEVRETMKHLKEAGIKIWMITGDKKETAVACGRSSCLIESEDFLTLSGTEAIKAIEESIELESAPRFSLNCHRRPEESQSSGETRQNVFDMQNLVIFRATPSQKGKIASLVVKSGRHTLAIGDGGNDIGMLKASDVGVGVIGKEGTQAAMAGDFAIPQFKLLRNLLFVHGRYCLQRYTSIVLNTYYKNIVFIFVQFIYNLFSGASGRPIYSSIIFNYYNLFFTSMIPFSISIFDKDVSKEDALGNPRTYRNVRNVFNNLHIYSNVLFAILEGSLIFFGVRLFLINEIANSTGKITGYSTFNIIFSIVVLYAVILRQIRSISYRVLFTNIAIGASIFLNVISIMWIQELYSKSQYAIFHLLSSVYFYFVIFSLASLIYGIDTIFENVNLYISEKLNENK